MKLLASFSGGKDSMLSIDRALNQGHQIQGLFVTISKDGDSWFHNINKGLLESVSKNIGIPIFFCPCRQGEYYALDYEKTMKDLVGQTGAQGCIFGDIDIDTHRQWAEKITASIGIEPIFPLWKENRKDVVREFLDKGYKAVIKKVNKTYLDSKYVGRTLDNNLIEEFELMGIDSCGENGEYHTLVYDGPLFYEPINIRLGEISQNEYSYLGEIDQT